MYKNESDFLIKPPHGLVDIWNSHMLTNAVFTENDIPFCQTYLPNGLPKELISYKEAKTLFNKSMSAGDTSFRHNAFIHFYIHDYLFDGPQNSIWTHSDKAMEIIRHFGGIITPDFSTYSDFPQPWKIYNTFRMRTFGHWMTQNSIPVINNVRWGTEETWWYCFDGIPKYSTISIGTVASGLKELENRADFEAGFKIMLKILQPQEIIIYGSANYESIKNLITNDIHIIEFPSIRNTIYRKEESNETIQRTI